MLQRLDNSDVEGSETADSITASPPEARPRGRPRGSRSRRSRESQEVVNEYAPRVWERIARKALGLPVYSEPDKGGRRTKRYASEEDEQACQRLIAERSLPSLKASERTIDQTVRASTLPNSLEDLALGVGRDPARLAETIRAAMSGEPAQLETIPSASDEAEAPSATALGAAGASPSLAATLPEPPAQVGDRHPAADGVAVIVATYREPGAGGRMKWMILDNAGAEYGTAWSRREAEGEAERLVAAGAIRGRRGVAPMAEPGLPEERVAWPRQRPRVHLGYQHVKRG